MIYQHIQKCQQKYYKKNLTVAVLQKNLIHLLQYVL